VKTVPVFLFALMLILASCGANNEATIATARGSSSIESALPAKATSTVPASTSETQQVSDSTLPFRTDVEVLSGPVFPEEGSVEPVARLIDRNGVVALEITFLAVPDGTDLLKYEVNGRIQAGGTYTPGMVVAMRIEPGTPIDLVVIAIDDADREIGRSAVQHIEQSEVSR